MSEYVFPREEIDMITKIEKSSTRGKEACNMVLKYFRSILPNLKDISGKDRSMDLFDYMMNCRIEVKNEDRINNHYFNRKFECDMIENPGTLTFIYINTKPCEMKEVFYANDVVFVNGYILTKEKLLQIKDYIQNRKEMSDVILKVRNIISMNLNEVLKVVNEIKYNTEKILHKTCNEVDMKEDNNSIIELNEESENKLSTSNSQPEVINIDGESENKSSTSNSQPEVINIEKTSEEKILELIRKELVKNDVDDKYKMQKERIDQYILDHYKEIFYDKMSKTILKKDLGFDKGGLNGDEGAMEVLKMYENNVLENARDRHSRTGKAACIIRFEKKLTAKIAPLMKKINIPINSITIVQSGSPEDQFIQANKDKEIDDTFEAIKIAFIRKYSILHDKFMIKKDFQVIVEEEIKKINSFATKVSQPTIFQYIKPVGVKGYTYDGKGIWSMKTKTELDDVSRNGAPKIDTINKFVESLTDKDTEDLIHDIDVEFFQTEKTKEVRCIGSDIAKPENIGNILSLHNKFFNKEHRLPSEKDCAILDGKTINVGQQLNYIKSKFFQFFSFILKKIYRQSSTDERYNLIDSINYCCQNKINFKNYIIYVINTKDGRNSTLYSYLFDHYYNSNRGDHSEEMNERNNVFNLEVNNLIQLKRNIIETFKLHQDPKYSTGHFCIKY